MKTLIWARRFLPGILVLVLAYLVVKYTVARFRLPGSMTVIEAQAMDMSQSGTPLGAAPVEVETVNQQRFAPNVTYSGSVVAFNDTDIVARVAGTLLELNAYPGQEVRPGQLIAKLDSVELSSRASEAEYASEAARHEAEMSHEERRQALAQSRAADSRIASARGMLMESRGELAAAEAMRDQADREVEAARAEVDDATAGVAATEADLHYSELESERQKRLLASGFVARRDADRATAELQTAQAKLKQAKALVTERQATLAAALAKTKQADANITTAKAKIERTRADIQTAQAEGTSASAAVQLNEHHTSHRGALAAQMSAQARTAQIVKNYTEIRAAESGMVTERLASPGTLLRAGQAILKVKNIDRVRLQANVAAADLNGIHAGSAVTANGSIVARVTSIFSAANPQSRTVTIEAMIPNPGHRLLPGQFVSMQIETGASRKSITVPQSALRRDEHQNPFVWILAERELGKTNYTCVMHPEVKSDHPGNCPKCGMKLTPMKKGGRFAAHRANVITGGTEIGRVEIRSGLGPGDGVVVRGNEYLNEGDSVTPAPYDANGLKALPAPSEPAPATGHAGMRM